MQVRLLPALEAQSRLLRMPRDERRFQAYLKEMTGSPDGVAQDIRLPLGHFNPMAKAPVRQSVQKWIDADAEKLAEAVGIGAGVELGWPVSIDLTLVVLDPQGTWTDRDRVDYQHRFEDGGGLKRGFATVQLWADEPADLDVLRLRTRAAVFRIGHQRLHGLPGSLPQMLEQEGRTLRFAGHAPSTTSDEQDAARAVIADLTRSGGGASGAVFALLYGDAAAGRLGHPPLGVAPGATWDVAVQDHGLG